MKKLQTTHPIRDIPFVPRALTGRPFTLRSIFSLTDKTIRKKNKMGIKQKFISERENMILSRSLSKTPSAEEEIKENSNEKDLSIRGERIAVIKIQRFGKWWNVGDVWNDDICKSSEIKFAEKLGPITGLRIEKIIKGE